MYVHAQKFYSWFGLFQNLIGVFFFTCKKNAGLYACLPYNGFVFLILSWGGVFLCMKMVGDRGDPEKNEMGIDLKSGSAWTQYPPGHYGTISWDIL